MGVDDGDLEVIDVDMILENCPITIVCNLLMCSTIQYNTIVMIVYDNKCHRTIPQYIMGYSVVHKNEPFNDWGGRGCHRFVPVLGGDGTKIAPRGNLFDEPPGEMSSIRGKLADHVGDHVVLLPEEVVLVPSPGMESSYPRLAPNRWNTRTL